MATIIDALIVTLGLDAKGFTEGSKKARKSLSDTEKEAARVAKEMEARGQQAAQFFAKIRNEALAMLAVFTAGLGLKEFAQHTITSTASLDRMSKNLDMSAKDLAEWQLANKHAGGTVEGMTAQLKEAQQEVENYKAGFAPSAAMKEFFNQGGTEKDLKSAKTYMLARSKITADLYKKNPGTGSFFAGKMGINEDAFNLLKQQPEDLERSLQAQSGLSEEQARASGQAEILRQKLDDLANQFEALGVKVMTQLMPQLERFADWIVAHKEDIAQWVEKTVKWIEEFASTLDKGAKSVGGWETVLIALIALQFAPLIAGVVSLAAAFVKLGAALGVIGGTTGTGALGVLGRLAAKLGLGATLLFHSEGLNTGEDEELTKRRNGKGAGTPNATQDSRKKYLALRLKNDGYSDAQAAGIIGSLMQESNLDPGAVNPKSGATGIAQWLGPRKKQFADRYKTDLGKSSLEQQVDFMLWELRNTEKRSGDLLRGATTPEAAAEIHSREYERPGAGEANIARRQANAANVVSMVNAAQAPARMATGNISTSTSEIHIQKIEVNTQATDSPGIAQAIKFDLERNLLPMLSYRGGVR